MTLWSTSVGDLLDLSADALICSANPQLNLSGGVGGALLLRYGNAMQVFLHDWLRVSGQKFVTPGTIVAAPPCGSPYRVVLHAVAINALYNTSAELIARLTKRPSPGPRNTAAIRLPPPVWPAATAAPSPDMFAAAMRTHWGRTLSGIERVELRSTNEDVIAALGKL